MKKTERFLQIISAAVFVAFVLFVLVVGVRYYKCRAALRSLPSFPSADYVHVLVYGSSENSVSGSISFYDTDGAEVSRLERSWNAGHINLEFVIIKAGEKTVVFPYRVFGGSYATFRSGQTLSRYILSDKECLLIGHSFGDEARKKWREAASFAFSPAARMFTFAVDYTTINLAGCQSGKEYLLIPDSFGNISFVAAE